MLGTDGYGRSDTRTALRDFFEIDQRYIALTALRSLAEEGAFPRERLADAMASLGIDPEKPSPLCY